MSLFRCTHLLGDTRVPVTLLCVMLHHSPNRYLVGEVPRALPEERRLSSQSWRWGRSAWGCSSGHTHLNLDQKDLKCSSVKGKRGWGVTLSLVPEQEDIWERVFSEGSKGPVKHALISMVGFPFCCTFPESYWKFLFGRLVRCFVLFLVFKAGSH